MVDYPSLDKVIELNVLGLSTIKAKKSDAPKVLSKVKILNVLESCADTQGSVFDKAVVLLKGLVQAHAFASDNRRTAFLSTKYFLVLNGSKTRVADNPENARVLLGIRENFYSDEEIREWIQHGQIKAFRR